VIMAENYERDSSVLHEALRAINSNQQTLAASMDQWRAEAKSDLTALNGRLGTLEAYGRSSLPTDGFEEIKAQIEDLRGSVRQEPVDGWTRFRIWLYGTDDWYGASWGDRSGGEHRGERHWTERGSQQV